MSSMKNRKASSKAAAKADAPEENSEKTRIVALIQGVAEKAPPKVQPYLRDAAPFLASAWIAFEAALPYIAKFLNVAQEAIAKLPEKVIYAILGVAICFFGGIFPATIAAVEAWNLCGGREAIVAIKSLYGEFNAFKKANEEDNKRDDNNDGIPDVDQMAPKEVYARKVAVALKALEPTTVNSAIACLYTGWMGVIATLRIQFARTVTLGEVIGRKLYGIVSHAEPTMKAMVSTDYEKWVPVLTKWSCKALAITLAWWIQRVISAVHSAIRGGFLFSKYLVEFLEERKYVDLSKYGPLAGELVGWSIAALGLLFQFACGFGVPFPFNLVTWPLNIVEYFIEWSVSSGGAPTF